MVFAVQEFFFFNICMRGRAQSEFHSDTLFFFFKYPSQPLLLTVVHSPLTIFSEGKEKKTHTLFFFFLFFLSHEMLVCVVWWTTCISFLFIFFLFSPLTCAYLSVLCVSVCFFFFISGERERKKKHYDLSVYVA